MPCYGHYTMVPRFFKLRPSGFLDLEVEETPFQKISWSKRIIPGIAKKKPPKKYIQYINTPLKKAQNSKVDALQKQKNMYRKQTIQPIQPTSSKPSNQLPVVPSVGSTAGFLASWPWAVSHEEIIDIYPYTYTPHILTQFQVHISCWIILSCTLVQYHSAWHTVSWPLQSH